MITEERDEMVLNSVVASLQTLSKSHSTQIVQNMIHYKLQNSVIYNICLSTYIKLTMQLSN